MKRLLGEPLLHFLVLGAVLFAAYGHLNRAPKTKPGELIVRAGHIEHLAARFAQFQQRPPTTEELKGLIDQYVREEILSREAVKLGLDQDDTVIRRRLQQKLEFVATDLTTAEEPTEADLADWLMKHPDNFRQEQRFSFSHVYLNPDKHGGGLDAYVAKLLITLTRTDAHIDASSLGDSFLLPQEFSAESQTAVASQFGPEFAGQLARLKTGEWTGPILSGYGVHLVLLTARTEGRLPALDEVRELVKRDITNDRRLKANREFLDALLAKYQVEIEWPKTDSINGKHTLAKTL